ncbi:MAG: hypothetical protein P8X63_11930, partial [Desulfuromonadaceae bacterium]
VNEVNRIGVTTTAFQGQECTGRFHDKSSIDALGSLTPFHNCVSGRKKAAGNNAGGFQDPSILTE